MKYTPLSFVTVHRSENRGSGDYGWLKTRYSFSFADWHDLSRMGFGALRVLNDDRIAPDSGFPPHAHRDMEIVTVVMKGAVTHEDSMGNRGIIAAGEVQAMSAGKGVVHAERNESSTEPLELFQLWIETRTTGTEPRYATHAFAREAEGLQLLAAPDPEDTDALPLRADAYVHHLRLPAGGSLEYGPHDESHGIYLFVIAGTAEALGKTLGARDALGAAGHASVEIRATEALAALLIEVPMRP